MKTGSEAFEAQNRAPGHRMTYPTREKHCPDCDDVVEAERTGNGTPGNRREYECPDCGATF